MSTSLRVVLALAAALFVAGVWWGWPGGAWAPDELQVADVIDGIGQHFSGGWFHRYPPLHFYVLAAIDAPFLIAARLHLVDIRASRTSDWLFLLSRLLSVTMAIGVVAAIGALARDVAGRRYAWAAALSAALFMPFVYYAKTANLDVPCLFWTSLSLLLLSRVFAGGSWRTAAGFGITAGFAIATKDQIAALYVLPVSALLYRVVRGRLAMTTVASAAGAALLTLVGAYNLIFNANGFVDRLTRLHAVVGPSGRAFRMFPATLAGQWSLAVATATQLGLMLGVGGVVFVMVGGVAIARGAAPRPPAWFALAAASYYCALIMPIGFIYDRFLLPLAPLLAVPAGIGLVTLLDVRTGPVLRRVARAFAAILVVSLLWRAVSVDAMLITDSRYAAERWLRDHVGPDNLVATIGEPVYLPRLPGPHQSIAPDPSVVLQLQPQFIVVNADYLPRFAGRAHVEGWLLWLQSLGGYRELYRVKTRLWWSALNWDSRFTDRREDGFTNLDKANPEIVIFGRPRS